MWEDTFKKYRKWSNKFTNENANNALFGQLVIAQNETIEWFETCKS